MRVALVVFVVASILAPAARADELAPLLRAGPLVRVETDAAGKFKEGLAIADVDVPVDVAWTVLKDFPGYAQWIPRVDECVVTRDGADYLLAMKIDTPLVATKYVNRVTVDDAAKTMRIRHEKGDLKGTWYEWRLVALGDRRTRLYYRGAVKNFSAVAQSMEDDQQTITIGLNVSSLLATVKAVKQRAEVVVRSPPSIGR